MKTIHPDKAAIKKLLEENYINGLYEGDINLLKQAFYPGTLLFGDVKGQPYFKTLDQYLEGVATRQSPKDSGKPFKVDILSINVENTIAIAELKVKMYDFNYHNMLSFHKLDGRWVIVNKMLTDTNN